MDLWIRSQDKEDLIQIKNRLFVSNGSRDKYCVYYDAFIPIESRLTLGTYATKERALEVLDEINERINIINILNLCKSDNSLIVINNTLGKEKLQGACVPYQMPKE